MNIEDKQKLQELLNNIVNNLHGYVAMSYIMDMAQETYPDLKFTISPLYGEIIIL